MEKKPQSKHFDTAANSPLDAESILLTLDQISQTIEVMQNVVGRLKSHIHNSTACGVENTAIDKRSNKTASPHDAITAPKTIH